MAKYLGNVMLLSVETAPASGTFGAIGGSSTHTLTFNNEQIDVSDKDSNRWKELLAAGDRSVTISMEGFVSDNTNFALIEAAVESDTILKYQLDWGDSRQIEGDFHIDSFEVSGARNEAQSFSATFTNSGEPTID